MSSPTTGPPADPPQALLLDYGGTLDADGWHWFDHFRALYEDAGARVAEDALKDAFYTADATLAADPATRGYGLVRMVEAHVAVQLRTLGDPDPSLGRRLVDAFVADTRGAWERNRPLLRRLGARYRLGVVSNAYGNMPALLADGDLGPFAVVLDSVLEGVAKPDLAIYARAADRLGLPPRTILHVGDSWERDVVPAHRVGMRTAWLTRAAAPAPSAPAGVWRLRALTDLAVLL